MICFVSIAFTSFDDDNIVHMFTIIIFPNINIRTLHLHCQHHTLLLPHTHIIIIL